MTGKSDVKSEPGLVSGAKRPQGQARRHARNPHRGAQQNGDCFAPLAMTGAKWIHPIVGLAAWHLPVRRLHIAVSLGPPGGLHPREVPMRIARRSALALLGSSALAGVTRPACGRCQIRHRRHQPAAHRRRGRGRNEHPARRAACDRGSQCPRRHRRLRDQAARAGRRHRDRRPVRSGAVGDQHPQDDRRSHRGRRGRPDGERQRQGDGAAAQPGQPRHRDAEFHQSRPDRSEVRRDVSAGRQGDLLPHLHHRCLPGSQHGQLHGGPAQGEVSLRGGRHRRLWRGPRRCVPGAVRQARHQGDGPRPRRSADQRLPAAADQDQEPRTRTRCTAAPARWPG